MEIGDDETVRREEDKRNAWQWENALRRHNFVGFAHEVLKDVIRLKVKEGTYDQWIEGAKQEMGKRIEERKAQGKGDYED